MKFGHCSPARPERSFEIRSIWNRSTCLGRRNLLLWCLTKRNDMRFALYTDVALARDLPELGLRRGELVKRVDHHLAPDGEEGYSIEVFNAVGETIALSSVPANALEALCEDEVLSVRPLAKVG